MATPAVIARLDRNGGWHGTTVTYGGDPKAIGPTLLNMVVDHGGDLDAVWRAVTAPTHGWSSFDDEVREDPRWESGGTGEFVVVDSNEDYAMDTACWLIFDMNARTLHVKTTAGEVGLFTFDAAGHALCEPVPAKRADWRRRCADYGTDDPASTASAVIPLLRAGLQVDGDQLTVQLREEAGLWAAIRRRGSGGAIRFESQGVVADLRLVQWQTKGDERTVIAIREASTLVLPRRCLRSQVRVEALLDGWLRGLADGIRGGGGMQMLWMGYLLQNDLLDLDLSPEALSSTSYARMMERLTARAD